MSNRSSDQRTGQDWQAEHEAWAAQAAQISDEEFLARVKTWDAKNPEIVARLTPEQRGY